MKGAFLNAYVPEGELILVQPLKQLVDWGIVRSGILWKLRRAVYGLRQSPKWWSDERDSRLRTMKFTVGSQGYYLQQNDADSQLWMLTKESIDSTERRSMPSTATGPPERRRGSPKTGENPDSRREVPSTATGPPERRGEKPFDKEGPTEPDELLGLLCVYVDDFLAIAPKGPIRDGLIQALISLWEFGPERILSEETSLTFLGIDWIMRSNGDIFLTQERFTKELLTKHKMLDCNPLQCITMNKPPEIDDIPSAELLTELQSYAGAFNWLATRTRPDLAYFTSLLASCASKQGAWGKDLAKKVLRYLAGSITQGLTMAAEGNEDDLIVFSHAGFAGADTKSQNGLVITWAGSILTWRSSRAALSALSTAEAELCAAALGWQVTEGIRYLLSTLRIFPKKIEVMIDNKAALTAATLGATWRTWYYAVRAKRLLEEHQMGRVQFSYCPTKEMVADALTKLATANVI